MSTVAIRQALENALNAIAGIVPSVAITASTTGTSATFTTTTPHGLTSGISITIAGHAGSTPSLNGIYSVVVTGASTFTLQHNVTKAAIASTVAGTGGTVVANLTAWENVAFAPVPLVPWQAVNFLFARPENPTFGGTHRREIGYMQVTLYYPIQRGTVVVMTRAELIRSTFPRGSSFVKSGITVNVPGTPEIVPGMVIDESYVVPIKIPYWADIFS